MTDEQQEYWESDKAKGQRPIDLIDYNHLKSFALNNKKLLENKFRNSVHDLPSWFGLIKEVRDLVFHFKPVNEDDFNLSIIYLKKISKILDFNEVEKEIERLSNNNEPKIEKPVHEWQPPKPLEPTELTDDNFEAVVINSRKLCVVDFWAPWCGPCLAMGPTIDSLATEYASKVNIGKINVDENPNLSINYGITSIPCILFIKNGIVIDKQIRLASRQVLEMKIKNHM